jgi:YihY family inner membrane protein
VTDARSALALVGSIRRTARAEQLTLLAAAIAYYAFVSMIPLTVVALVAASLLGGPAFVRTVDALVAGILTPQSTDLLESALTSGVGRDGATLLGLAVLAWSALKVFRAIDAAFSRIYGAGDVVESLPEQLVDAAIVLGGVALATGVAAWLVAMVPRFVPALAGALTPLASALLLPVALFPIYYAFPDVDVSLREALPGAAFAGLGWTVLAWLFGVYAAYAGAFQLYGLLGGVLLLLTWFYAAALLVLLGAVVNAVLADRATDRQLQQDRLRDVANGNP